MREVGIAEAKKKLSSLLQAVERGEEIVIANRRRPVARLLPIEKPRHRPVFGSAKAAFDRSGLTWEDVDRALAPMSDEELAEWGLLEPLCRYRCPELASQAWLYCMDGRLGGQCTTTDNRHGLPPSRPSRQERKDWMAGSRPAMTRERGRPGEVSLFAGMEQPLIGRIPIRW